MINKIYLSIRDSSWMAYLAAFLGGLTYFVQAWHYTHVQTVLFDEGGYLYSGLLFARGILRPFQDDGLIRLYAPLAYLIPGKIEAWFGAGLRTGRYFSIFCSLVMMTALWLTSRRLGGKWRAAAVVWAMALTPISIQIYSLAITEALVACLLVCSLAFVLGEDRAVWQVVAGAILAGLAVMTRQNLVPLIPLLVVYVFWQHGKVHGWWALAGCLLPIVIIHAIFWPNILELWAVWLPARLTPFLDPYRVTTANFTASDGVGFLGHLSAFLQGIRFHYFTTIGFCICLFLWPRRDGWDHPANKRMAFFLAALFLTLALVHAGASFLISSPAVSCTFCFTPYLAFFDVVVFLLLVVTIPSWKRGTSVITLAAMILFVVLLFTGLGYAAFDRIGNWILDLRFPAINRGMDPRTWFPFISLQQILANKFHLDFWNNRAPVAALFGLIAGIAFLGLARYAQLRLLRKKLAKGYSFAAIGLILLLGAGVFVSPLLGGSYRNNGLCQSDTLRTAERIGQTIEEAIPGGSQVYWAGSTPVPLLYAPSLRVFPPQIYSAFYYRRGGNSEVYQQHGFWNDQLASQWIQQVSYIIASSNWPEAPDYPGEEFLSKFSQTRTLPPNPCDPELYLTIYQKKP
jgi:hypothetical protein